MVEKERMTQQQQDCCRIYRSSSHKRTFFCLYCQNLPFLLFLILRKSITCWFYILTSDHIVHLWYCINLVCFWYTKSIWWRVNTFNSYMVHLHLEHRFLLCGSLGLNNDKEQKNKDFSVFCPPPSFLTFWSIQFHWYFRNPWNISGTFKPLWTSQGIINEFSYYLVH